VLVDGRSYSVIDLHERFTETALSTYQFSMTSHSFGNGRHFVSNLLM